MIREYGDGQQLVVHIEKNCPAHNQIKKLRGVAEAVKYYDLNQGGKHVATDFYFRYTNRDTKARIKARLNKPLISQETEGT